MSKKNKTKPNIVSPSKKSMPASVIDEHNRNKFLSILLIIALCCVIYLPSLGNQFIWDDDMLVYENQYVQRTDGLKDIWLSRKTYQYYPVIFSLFWLEHKLWGLNPSGYRFVNLCFHTTNAILIFLLLCSLRIPGAFIISLIFAVHPIQVETVAWISERKNLACVFFFLLTIFAYIRFDRKRTPASYMLTLLLFVLALLSKSITVCFVTIPILYAWWREGKFGWREVKITIPFALVGLAGALNTIYMEFHTVGARGSEWGINFMQRFLISGRSFWFYIYKICFPIKFVFFYPRYVPSPTNMIDWIWPLLMIITGIILYKYRKPLGRGAFVLYAFYFISIFPALGFINVYPFRYSFVADHFVYLSSFCLLTLIFITARFLYSKVALKTKEMPVTVLKTFLVLIILFLTFKAQSLTSGYKDHISQWETVIRKNPTSWAAYNNLGYYYTHIGKSQQAIPLLKKAIELMPNDDEALCNLSRAYIVLGNFNKGIENAKASIAINKRNKRAFSNLGAAYIKRKEYAKALEPLLQAIKIDPNFIEASSNLATAYSLMGRDTEAINLLEKTIKKNPNYYQAYFNLGNSYRRIRSPLKAIAVYKKALKLNPNYTDAYNNLGNAYREAGNLNQAMLTFKTAIDRKLATPDTYNNLGVVFKSMGRAKEAIKAYQAAAELNPNYVVAYINLTYLFYDIKNIPMANLYMERAQKHGHTFDEKFVAELRSLNSAPK